MRKPSSLLLVLFSLAAAGQQAQAVPNPGSSEPVCTRSDVLFCEDWEDGDHVGWDWNNSWNACMPILNSGGYQSASALKQHIGLNLAECGYPGHDLGNQSVQTAPLYMRWYVKFGPGYLFLDWTDQKNNYFRALVNGQQTWRMMLGIRSKSASERNLGQIVIDAIGHDPRWYYNGTSDPPNAAAQYIATNEWHCIEWAIKGNTPGQSNGWMKVWLDDKVYMNYAGQNLKSTGDPINQAPWFSSYYGGDPPGLHPPQDLWYDNVVISRQRIGCGTGTSTPDDPALPNVDNLRRTDVQP